MFNSRNLLVVMFAVTCLLLIDYPGKAQSSGTIVRWVVEKNSKLTVEGKSNVNTFSCNINEYAEKDTIQFTNTLNKPVRLTGNLEMDILRFGCNNKLVTQDLRKTLKATEYPKMIITFISLNSTPQLQHKTEYIKGWITVEIAGVVKTFEMCYTFTVATCGYIQLNGSRNFCFSDFKLVPPKKFAGLVKIKDGFEVNFQLVLRAV